MAKIIDGKKISAEIKEELKTEVAAYAAQGKKCALAVIQVGADPASSVYVRNKKKYRAKAKHETNWFWKFIRCKQLS